MTVDHYPRTSQKATGLELNQQGDPLLLRLGPEAARQLAGLKEAADYQQYKGAIQARLQEEAAAIGRKDTGGYGIVESPEERYYVSLFPEDLGARLTETERQQQGLSELAQMQSPELDTRTDQEQKQEQLFDDAEAAHAADAQRRDAERFGREARQLAVSASTKEEAPAQPMPEKPSPSFEYGRDQSSMEAGDISKLQRLGNDIDTALEPLAMPERESDVNEFGSGENATRGLIESLKTELDLFKRGLSNRTRTAGELESLVNDLNTRYGFQEAKFKEVLEVPTQTMKNQMEADTLYDAQAFLREQVEAGFSGDVGQLGVLKERIKRTQDLVDAQWGSILGMNPQLEERKTIAMYTLRPLVDEFRDAQWGIETTVAQLEAVVKKLDEAGDTINGRYRVYRETLDEAKRIIDIKK